MGRRTWSAMKPRKRTPASFFVSRHTRSIPASVRRVRLFVWALKWTPSWT